MNTTEWKFHIFLFLFFSKRLAVKRILLSKPNAFYLMKKKVRDYNRTIKKSAEKKIKSKIISRLWKRAREKEREWIACKIIDAEMCCKANFNRFTYILWLKVLSESEFTIEQYEYINFLFVCSRVCNIEYYEQETDVNSQAVKPRKCMTDCFFFLSWYCHRYTMLPCRRWNRKNKLCT